MGLFKKTAAYMGHIDKKLLKTGVLARGTVTECEHTAMSTGNQVKSVVCHLTVVVEMEGVAPYTAKCTHPIQMPYLPQFESGQGVVAVRGA